MKRKKKVEKGGGYSAGHSLQLSCSNAFNTVAQMLTRVI